jgi:hypothetical protein
MDHADLAAVEELEKNPEWAPILGDAFVKIYRGFFDPAYVAIVVDRWGDALTFGDVYSFVRVHSALSSGQALMTQVDVGAQPRLDKYVKENNTLLQALPYPFSAEFWGGKADDDGVLTWSEAIEASARLADGSEKVRMISPGTAPLEVGHTNGFTTLRHLSLGRRLARWPYDSTTITVIHMVEK